MDIFKTPNELQNFTNFWKDAQYIKTKTSSFTKPRSDLDAIKEIKECILHVD